MRSQLFLFIFANLLLFDVCFIRTRGFKVVDHDLEVAGSEKHEKEWEEDDEEDFFSKKEEKKGGDSKKGWDEEHK